MMLSRYFGIFVVLVALWTVSFHYSFNLFAADREWMLGNICAVLYGVALFLTAWIMSVRIHREGESGSNYGFEFHLASFIITNGIWLAWIKAGWSVAHSEKLVYTVIFWWGLMGVLPHLILVLRQRRNLIRGMWKGEIFE